MVGVHGFRAPRLATVEVREQFDAVYGIGATSTARAPGRVNLIGEHTDHNGGLCLPFALPHATYAAVRLRSDDVVRIRSTDVELGWSGTVGELRDAPGWTAYVAGTLWALGIEPGIDVLVTSDVPIGAGLSSSAALTCAVAVAAVTAFGDSLTDELRRRVLTATIRAENDVVGVPTGGLDQATALFAPDAGALLLDFSTDPPSREPVPLHLAGHELLVVDTQVRHALADGGYAQRRQECADAAARLGLATLSLASAAEVARLAAVEPVLAARVRHVLTENDRVRSAVAALGIGDAAALGQLLDDSHRSLRADFAVSCPELDAAVEAAVSAGALGARMVGGGFGGSVLALVRAEGSSAVREAVVDRFLSEGWTEPTFIYAGTGSAQASGGRTPSY